VSGVIGWSFCHLTRCLGSCAKIRNSHPWSVYTDSTGTVVTVKTDEFLAEFIYNSVTTLLVGEKVMIEMPTYYFPSGAGVTPGNGSVANLGQPDPLATFRFAEPVTIEPQQNFRVEMLFPQDVPAMVLNAPGPLRIWVVLDGYLTRDVQ
jgi:hypothetical protein